MAIGDLVIDAYGISWTLDTSSTEPILYYNHPSFGMLAYQYVSIGGRPWQCNNVNTMTLVSHGSLPEGVLKPHICVKPYYDCYDSIADCGFASAEDRCNCADPCCPCIDGSIVIECGTLQRFTGRWCTGGRIGIADPAGPSREWCLTFYDFESTAHLLCTVIYCDGTSWLMDIYCDDDFVSTQTMALASKCPLRFTFSIPSLSCANCNPGVTTECCPDDPLPTTIMVSDGTDSWTMIYNESLGYWEDTSSHDGFGCTAQTATLQCTAGSWYFSLNGSGQSCSPTGSCSPLLLTCTFFGCDTNSYSLTFTAA